MTASDFRCKDLYIPLIKRILGMVHCPECNSNMKHMKDSLYEYAKVGKLYVCMKCDLWVWHSKQHK
jgi:uncharacterized protein with PIN domain